jgi:hypothetical protein
MKLLKLVHKHFPWHFFVAFLFIGCASFESHQESGEVKGKLVPLTDPIPQKIKKGEIVVAAIERFRMPTLQDSTTAGATTKAYARVQYLKPVGDGSGRLAICDLRGVLYLADQNGDKLQQYLDLRSHDLSFDTSKMPNETGFAGFAFHPEFSKEGKPGYGKLYIAFSASSGSGEANYLKDDAASHESVVTEWTTDNPTAVPFRGTRREVFRVGQFAPNHNVGSIAFNPAAEPGTSDYGNLYLCMGDGGAAFDPKDYGQSLQSPQGAILRINPLATSDGGSYQIPDDNPFVSSPNVAPEIWAYGLRHPQHFSWDQTGRMFIGDIGQDQVEEVNVGIAGANYGWRLREGTFSSGFGVEGAGVGPVYALPHEGSETFTDPVAQYDHDEGRAIGSGYVYEGTLLKELIGKYVFADIVRGRIFYIETKNLKPGKLAEIQELRIVVDGKEQDLIDVVGYPNTYRAGSMRADLRLGVDEAGELYLLTKGDGWVRKLVPVKPAK